MASESTGQLSPAERVIRWGGLAMIVTAIAAYLMGIPGAEILGLFLFWLGVGCYVAMGVLAGVRKRGTGG